MGRRRGVSCRVMQGPVSREGLAEEEAIGETDPVFREAHRSDRGWRVTPHRSGTRYMIHISTFFIARGCGPVCGHPAAHARSDFEPSGVPGP